MKLLCCVAVVALTTATASFAQSNMSQPGNGTAVAPQMQDQSSPAMSSTPATTTPMKVRKSRHASNQSRATQDAKENRETAQLNRQQAASGGAAVPQTATQPSEAPVTPVR